MQAVAGLLLAAVMSQTASPAATGGLTGRVTVAGSNTPIAGARVLVFPAGRTLGPMGPPPQATTDQDGRFALDQLAPGEYRIDVQKTGFAPLAQPPAPPPTVTVAAGRAATVDLRLQRGGVVSGRVLDATGEPLADARVMAMRRMPAPPTRRGGPGVSRLMPAPMQGPQQTNDLGEFRIAGLAPGEYVIAAVPRGGFGGPGIAPPSPGAGARTTAVTTFYPGTTDQAGAQAVTVTAGAEVDNIFFTVQSAPAFRVSGIVVDEAGAPVPDAMVTLTNDPRRGPFFGSVGSGRSDASGRFAIEEVPAGSYRANASIMIRSSSGGVGMALSGGVISWTSGPTGIVEPAEIVVTDNDISDVRVVARRNSRQ